MDILEPLEAGRLSLPTRIVVPPMATQSTEAGYDDVELHSAHGYLLNQFFSPLTKFRTDAYGLQSVQSRTHFLAETVRKVRAAVGDDFPVSVRLGGSDYAEGGSTIADAVEAARILERDGVDLVNLSGGLNVYMRRGHREPGWFADMSTAVRRATHTPVMLTGGVRTPEQARRLLDDGAADLIGVGRAMLRNPRWGMQPYDGTQGGTLRSRMRVRRARQRRSTMARKVLVVGTSPRLHGNSNILAEAFADGARETGNDVEFVPLAGKRIGFCVGCWGCLKTKGCVVNHDDAEVVVQKIRTADVVAFATPIYHYEMSGQMKTLLDRTNCLYTADYSFRDVYLLTAAEATAPDTPEHAIGGLRGWLKVFKKAQLKGTVFAGGTTDDGTVRGRPEVEEARQLGRGV